MVVRGSGQDPQRPRGAGPRIPAAALLAGLALSAPRAQEGGIEIFAGETLFESGWRVSVTELYKPRRELFRGANEVADPLGREFLESRTVLGLDYGLDRGITLSALVPFVYRELETGGRELTASGLGDIALLGKYRLLGQEWQGGAFNWSALGGLEIPTGATDAREGGVRLPPMVQVGTGAWSPFAATSATLDLERARFDATVFYKVNTEGTQDFELGDFFSLTALASYRFLHFKYPGPTFAARGGLQWRHESRAHRAGVTLADSGTDELLLRVGLSSHPVPAMDLSLDARVPVYTDYNGTQLARGVELFLAVGLRF